LLVQNEFADHLKTLGLDVTARRPAPLHAVVLRIPSGSRRGEVISSVRGLRSQGRTRQVSDCTERGLRGIEPQAEIILAG
jgi:hypothetical protein